MVKDKLMSFFKWVISNIIWTIITYIVPFTLLIPLAYNIITSVIYKKTYISILSIALMIIFFAIEIFLFIMTQKTKVIVENDKSTKETAATNNGNKDTEEISTEQNNEYYNSDYFFENYHKHLTVYKDGTGIIINSFTLVINNIDSITEFKRELDINDAKESTVFPKLETMKVANLNDRFCKFGFWCKCLNNDKLITSIEEKYWTDKDENSDNISKEDPKILKWILRMNPSSVETGKPYKIVYVISIPGMFPIENGLFAEEISNIKGTNGNFQSQFNVRHKIKQFIYTVSFENELELQSIPTGHIAVSGGKKNLHFVNDNNIIYDKYIFSIDDPSCHSAINIEWQFKARQVNENGGQEHGEINTANEKDGD